MFVPIARGDVIEALNDGPRRRRDGLPHDHAGAAEAGGLLEPDGATNVSEIVVTAPGTASRRLRAETCPAVSSTSGKDSSYYQSVEALNAELKKAGKPPVKIRIAPDNLEAEDILEMVNAGLVPATIADDGAGRSSGNRSSRSFSCTRRRRCGPAASYGWMVPQEQSPTEEGARRVPRAGIPRGRR